MEKGAEYSEICVLVRSNVIGEEVASYLVDNGVPVITDDSLKVKGAMSVRRLVSLMSYVDNPEDTVNGYLAESMNMELPDGSWSLVDMAEFIVRNMKDADEQHFMQGEVIYLQSFMDYLQAYVASNGNNLRGFLKYWEGEDPSISSPSSGNSVRVMTIHKSKGLDFPYVILPFAENITLFKAGKYWCSPDLKGTALEGVADGVYDVTLSSSSEATLFREHYRRESFLQQVDNINTIYVAMTRAASGMHIIAKTPSAKFKMAADAGERPEFSDFSQIMYWFLRTSDALEGLEHHADGEVEAFTFGELSDFTPLRKEDDMSVRPFDVKGGMEYPSFPLNPQAGRLRFSPDALDFFSEDDKAGISASSRLRGVALHDILSRIKVSSDLEDAIMQSVLSGEIDKEEASDIKALLEKRLSEVEDLDWFPQNGARIYNEADIIDTDGHSYRPDRVVVNGRKVIIVDYKSGEHYAKYEQQLMRYARIWKSMGYAEVSAYLWYLQTGEIMHVC